MNNLPDISFVNKDVETLLNESIADFEKAYFEQTGQVKKLYPGDPIRIFLYSQALREFQLLQVIDYAAKQNLLAYAERPYINHLGAFKGVEELTPDKSKVSMRFNLSSPQSTVQIIPRGTRSSPGNNIYFEATENIEVPAGSTQIIFPATCLTPGTIGNGFTPGQINILSDPLPWVASVENIDTSQGGSDIESLESLRERIWLSPEEYSVAGPELAYISLAKGYSSLIEDVQVESPSGSVLDIRFILKGGELPTETFSEGLIQHLSAKDKRPITDRVSGGAPDQIEYNIDLTYYIRSSDISKATEIQKKVEKAIDDYRLWQKTKISRDINPSELNARIIKAGAKRAQINEPTFIPVGKLEVAKEVNVTINYGGLEDE